MKLNQREISKFEYEGKAYAKGGSQPDFRWADQPKGFGVRVFPSGVKTFIFRYRQHGRQHIVTIGEFGTLTYEDARERALKLAVGVVDGGDPATDRRRKEGTVSDLCTYYLEHHAIPNKRSWKMDRDLITNHILPALGTRRVDDVKRSDVALLHGQIGKHSIYVANQVYRLLRSMFNKALVWGFLPEDKPNPARSIPLFKEVKRERFIERHELPILMKAVASYPNVYVQKAIWLYLFTGCRKMELMRSKWEHVDYKKKVLKLPITKSGKSFLVPLSNEAIDLIKSIPRQLGNPYLFPGEVNGKHLINIYKAWRRILRTGSVMILASKIDEHKLPQAKIAKTAKLKPAELNEILKLKRRPDNTLLKALVDACGLDIAEVTVLENLRIHDLRRTVGSWIAQAGGSIQVVQQALNHATIDAALVYARLGESPARAALQSYSSDLAKAATRDS